MSVAHQDEDRKLRLRVRRSLIEAEKVSLASPEDHRRALILTAEIRGHIKLLAERLGLIEEEMRSASHRAGAMSAYQKAASQGRTPARRGGKGLN